MDRGHRICMEYNFYDPETTIFRLGMGDEKSHKFIFIRPDDDLEFRGNYQGRSGAEGYIS